MFRSLRPSSVRVPSIGIGTLTGQPAARLKCPHLYPQAPIPGIPRLPHWHLVSVRRLSTTAYRRHPDNGPNNPSDPKTARHLNGTQTIERRRKLRYIRNALDDVVENHMITIHETMQSEIRRILDHKLIEEQLDHALTMYATHVSNSLRRVVLTTPGIEELANLPSPSSSSITTETPSESAITPDARERNTTLSTSRPTKVFLSPDIKEEIRRVVEKAVDSYGAKFCAVSAPFIKADITRQIQQHEFSRREKQRDFIRDASILLLPAVLFLGGIFFVTMYDMPLMIQEDTNREEEKQNSDIKKTKETKSTKETKNKDEKREGGEKLMEHQQTIGYLINALADTESKAAPTKEERKSLLPPGWKPRLVYVGGDR